MTKPDHAQPGDADALPAPETIVVTSHRVKCDGGGGALGHPLVYYDMGEDHYVECLYCDRRFVLDPNAPHGH
ncbi:MAG: zinc-finger domain-containing protein [Caulobacterales bacterium]